MKEWIDGYFDTHVELLKTLAAIPAPSHHEDRRVAFIKNWLEEAGAEGVYVDSAKNVILPFGLELPGKITVYMAHTDVVFPDLTPLPVRAEGGNIYAPGVGDDTANVVGVLTSVKYILEHGLKPREPVLLVLNSCEEGLGNLDGSRQIMKDFAGRVGELISFDGGYKGGMTVRAVGSERWRIRCRTVGGHSYGSFGNPNAIHRLAGLIMRFYEQPLPDWEDQKTTYNVGTISGGTSVNTIAQDAEMLYEYRSDDRKALQFMHDQFFRILEEAKGPDASFDAELLGERPCSGEIDEEAFERLLARCEKEIAKVAGEPVKRHSGSTDANIPLATGTPAVTFGLCVGEKAHTREEWVNVESLREGLPIAINLITSHFA
ncbi:MAG: M20/M25/M40 family metallo-hydrolase [Clostridia bacterium]|nr:M20/M25/M40 family metallo-hydrolase [Clostridia bacterium]